MLWWQSIVCVALGPVCAADEGLDPPGACGARVHDNTVQAVPKELAENVAVRFRWHVAPLNESRVVNYVFNGLLGQILLVAL
jgi:hypothetical protein